MHVAVHAMIDALNSEFAITKTDTFIVILSREAV